MLKNLSNIQGSKAINKTAQKHISGGFGPGGGYLENCSPWDNGEPCLTGLPHCPVGICATGVCSPLTGH